MKNFLRISLAVAIVFGTSGCGLIPKASSNEPVVNSPSYDLGFAEGQQGAKMHLDGQIEGGARGACESALAIDQSQYSDIIESEYIDGCLDGFSY
jgi:hypothetical protein